MFQLYDRISSKVVSPVRAPPSDAVIRCRDLLDALRDYEQSLSPGVLELEISGEIEELRELLTHPHFKVSQFSTTLLFTVCTTHSIISKPQS